MVADPNCQLRNAQKGIVANAVRQSLEFQLSVENHDYLREQRLFGKTYKDIILNEDICRHTGQTQSSLQPSNSSVNGPIRQRMHISKLEPQGSLQSYQAALGLSNKVQEEQKQTTAKRIPIRLKNQIRLQRENSVSSVASQSKSRERSALLQA